MRRLAIAAALLLTGCPESDRTEAVPPDADVDAGDPVADASTPDASDPMPEPDAGLSDWSEWWDSYCADRPLPVGAACDVTERADNGNQVSNDCELSQLPTGCEVKPVIETLTVGCREVCTFGCDVPTCDDGPVFWADDKPVCDGKLEWKPDTFATETCAAIGATCQQATLAGVTRSWCLP